MRFVFICLALLQVSNLISVEKVTFLSADGLRITADLYIQDKSKPFILLFHQANYSRGEYKDIAPKLQKLGFNCLAVDLRSGNEVNYIENETAKLAKKQKKPNGFIDARADVEASLKFINSYTTIPVILFGSSYSASLCLMVATKNPNVDAVIAFSPGEYFRPEISVKDKITDLKKPVFIGSSEIEHPFIKDMLSDIPTKYKTFYKPSGKGVHGSKILWPSEKESDTSWFNLIIFLNQLN